MTVLWRADRHQGMRRRTYGQSPVHRSQCTLISTAQSHVGNSPLRKTLARHTHQRAAHLRVRINDVVDVDDTDEGTAVEVTHEKPVLVTALGPTLAGAAARAYAACEKIECASKYYRRDIGARQLNRKP